MKLCIFDVDGTLTQSNVIDDRCFVRAFNDALGIRGFSADWLNYEFQTDSGLTMEICQRHLGRQIDRDELGRLKACFFQHLDDAVREESFREIDGAKAFFGSKTLRDCWKIAIATGGWDASARFKLASAHFKIDSLPIASADDAIDRVDILRTAIRRTEATYEQSACSVVYIGDNLWDLRAARKLGVGFVGIASGTIADRLRQEGAAYVFPNFLDQAATLAAMMEACDTMGESSCH